MIVSKKFLIPIISLIGISIVLVLILILRTPKRVFKIANPNSIASEKNQEKPENNQNQAMSDQSNQKNQDQQEIKEFDDSFLKNKDQAVPALKEDQDKNQIKVMVRLFLEDYGSFSTNSGYLHIEQLSNQMTPGFWQFTQNWIDQDPALQKSAGFYAIMTDVLDVRILDYSSDQAKILLDTKRTETDAPEYYDKSFKQEAEVELIKQAGQWKVNAVYWK